MGVIIPFETRTTRRAIARGRASREVETIDVEMALMAAMRDGRDSCGILVAAGPLLERCRDRYGFTVMQPGLSPDPEVLAGALLTLARGLALLEVEFGHCRPYYRSYGVYFGQQELAWFEDGYGGNAGLAVPVEIDATALAGFLRPRIRKLRR